MTYFYKRLRKTNIPLFKSLLKVFGEAFEEIETYQKAIPSNDYLKRLLGKEDFIALVALKNKQVVGGLVAYVLEKFEQERREIYIYDLAVAQDHRRKGVATTLIKHLREIAKKQGAYVIFVQADLEDAPAIQLYESLGTREDVHHFDISPQ